MIFVRYVPKLYLIVGQAHNEEKADIRAKLESLREREKALNLQLVELQGQAKAFATQSVERERHLAAVARAGTTGKALLFAETSSAAQSFLTVND